MSTNYTLDDLLKKYNIKLNIQERTKLGIVIQQALKADPEFSGMALPKVKRQLSRGRSKPITINCVAYPEEALTKVQGIILQFMQDLQEGKVRFIAQEKRERAKARAQQIKRNRRRRPRIQRPDHR